jgi:hypothetical protein
MDAGCEPLFHGLARKLHRDTLLADRGDDQQGLRNRRPGGHFTHSLSPSRTRADCPERSCTVSGGENRTSTR